ncbi:MAG: hypothetical protein M5U30_12075 [Burkholderiaceae bacterium]|nr:hypothetical protein [Burkholderiaceae bacterium]
MLQRPFSRPLEAVRATDLRAAYAPLLREVDEAFARDGIAEPDREVRPLADLRYQGQMHELTLMMPNGVLEDWWSAGEVFEAFRARHEHEFGFAEASIPAEIVNLRVEAVGRVGRPDVHAGVPAGHRHGVGKGSRPVYLGPRAGHVRAVVVQRAEFAEGDVVQGPAIINQPDTTILVLPAQSMTVLRGGVLQIRESEAAQ